MDTDPASGILEATDNASVDTVMRTSPSGHRCRDGPIIGRGFSTVRVLPGVLTSTAGDVLVAPPPLDESSLREYARQRRSQGA